ncbi:MAG: hypothetical protein IJU69_00065 [Bacteroidales bacterium]|nr:hypothetical protein [Bacteroidales bacterium]
MSKELKISSPETMIEVIRGQGIIPFFRSGYPGWSIEERTAPGCWFFETEGVLGPWDWKIDAVRTGEIAYGKFIGGKAAFATTQWYRHLMNWRRSLPLYRMALGEEYQPRNRQEEKMMRLAPAALSHIRKSGESGARELRTALSAIDSSVKKATVDSVLQFLQMGTWTVIGEFERVYRGPNLEYNGWQRASNTTPEALFGEGGSPQEGKQPFWASIIEDDTDSPLQVDCSPEESRALLLEKFPGLGAKKL